VHIALSRSQGLIDQLKRCAQDYFNSVEWQVFDKAIGMAYAAYQYIVEESISLKSAKEALGEHNDEDYYAAKLLWLYLYYWGNIGIGSCNKSTDLNFDQWSKGIGRELVKTLKRWRGFLKELSGLSCEELAERLLRNEDKMNRLRSLYSDIVSKIYSCSNKAWVGAAKLLWLMTKGSLPLMDKGIARCVLEKEVESVDTYIEFIERMIGICMKLKQLIYELKSDACSLKTDSSVIGLPGPASLVCSDMNMLDKALWTCTQKYKEFEPDSKYCDELRRLASNP
jgi:hypothetical protein